MSQDIPHMARNLVKRMLSDPRVDIQNHWKLITILIGGNDFCANICYTNPPEKTLMYHEKNILSALRTFRDYLPRTFVNLVASPSKFDSYRRSDIKLPSHNNYDIVTFLPHADVDILTQFKGKPQECVTMHVIECPCFMATRFTRERKRYIKLIEKWNRLQMDIANRKEFNSKPDFGVVFQPFIMNISIPEGPNGGTDFSYMSLDCFHLSQKGYARASNALWNNMFEPVGGKHGTWEQEFSYFRCPTPEMPYIRTLGNS